MHTHQHSFTRRVSIFLGIIAAVFFVPAVVFAQSQAQVKIQPLLFEKKIDPGTEFTEVLSISNLSDSEQTYYPRVRDIVGIGDDQQPIYANEEDAKNGMALSSWITFDRDSLTLRPGTSASVRFTVRVPKDASPGSHLAGIFFSYQPPLNRQNATGVGYDVGSILNLQIAGEVDIRAMVREFSTSKVVYGEPKVVFQTRVDNLGNVFVRPRGLIEIENLFGEKIDTVMVNENATGIIPGNTRTYEARWEDDGFHIGRYRARLALSYGEANAQQSLSAAIDFWIIPVGTLLPIFGALLAFAVVFYVILRMYIRSQIARLGGGRAAIAERENARGLSRLAAVVIAILISVIVGLLLLFFYFG